MLGILTTVLMNLSQQQVGIEKRSETNVELGFFHTRLAETFNDKQSCVNTLGGLGGIISNGQSITAIKNNANPPVDLYTVNYQFGKRISGGGEDMVNTIHNIRI